MLDNCPRCGMAALDEIQGWACGSIASWLDGSPQIQSAACAEIARLKARNAKLERVAKAAIVINRHGKYSADRAWTDLAQAITVLEAPDA